MLAGDVASRALGIDVHDVSAGAATATMTIRPDMVNGHGITFVAPSHDGDVLEARAVERTRFGRSGIYDVTVRRGDDVIAEFRGTSRSIGQNPGVQDSEVKSSGVQ